MKTIIKPTIFLLLSLGLVLIYVGVSTKGDAKDRITMMKLVGRVIAGKATGTASVKKDLDSWCQIFEESERKPFDSDRQKSNWITEQILQVSNHGASIKVFKDLGATDPDQKWLVVKDAANKDGYPDWDCPSMRRILPPAAM